MDRGGGGRGVLETDASLLTPESPPTPMSDAVVGDVGGTVTTLALGVADGSGALDGAGFVEASRMSRSGYEASATRAIAIAKPATTKGALRNGRGARSSPDTEMLDT